jgi:hypothetical protein
MGASTMHACACGFHIRKLASRNNPAALQVPDMCVRGG